MRAAAEAFRAANPDDPPLLKPIVCYECSYCPWWAYCRSQLDDDDLSLRISKAPLDVRELQTLLALGIKTVAELAEADVASESYEDTTFSDSGDEVSE